MLFLFFPVFCFLTTTTPYPIIFHTKIHATISYLLYERIFYEYTTIELLVKLNLMCCWCYKWRVAHRKISWRLVLAFGSVKKMDSKIELRQVFFSHQNGIPVENGSDEWTGNITTKGKLTHTKKVAEKNRKEISFKL